MKMRETSPVHFPCRNHWVLTCLTLVALFLMTTTSGEELSEIKPAEDLSTAAKQYGLQANGSSTQPSPVLPGKLMPSNIFTSSQSASPPSTATLEMECTSPGGSIEDLCWLDNNTMILVHFNNKVFKVLVNRQNKSCSFTELDSPPNPIRIACSPETGEIYIIDYSEKSVRVYDRNSLKAVWKPEGLVGIPLSVAMNRERIVVGTYSKGYLYVYDRNREYIGQINITQSKHQFYYTQLTEEGLFVASTYTTHRLIIHELGTGFTVIIGGQGSENGEFNYPCGVSIVGDYILVSDINNNRVPVFATNVGFHGNLQFKGANVERPQAQAYRSETKLLAIHNYISPYIVKIFSLT